MYAKEANKRLPCVDVPDPQPLSPPPARRAAMYGPLCCSHVCTSMYEEVAPSISLSDWLEHDSGVRALCWNWNWKLELELGGGSAGGSWGSRSGLGCDETNLNLEATPDSSCRVSDVQPAVRFGMSIQPANFLFWDAPQISSADETAIVSPHRSDGVTR